MDDLEEVVNLESAAFKMTKEQTRDDMVGRIFERKSYKASGSGKYKRST